MSRVVTRPAELANALLSMVVHMGHSLRLSHRARDVSHRRAVSLAGYTAKRARRPR